MEVAGDISSNKIKVDKKSRALGLHLRGSKTGREMGHNIDAES